MKTKTAVTTLNHPLKTIKKNVVGVTRRVIEHDADTQTDYIGIIPQNGKHFSGFSCDIKTFKIIKTAGRTGNEPTHLII